jgi:hypothetical protein
MEAPKPLVIGKFRIPEPCAVPWDEMQDHDGVNRNCSRCNSVVHDLTGMSMAEIDQLYAANNGKLCGNITVDELRNPLYFKGTEAKRKPVYLKHLAAAASMFLIYQSPQASPPPPSSAPTQLMVQPLEPKVAESRNLVTEANNTLVTGVVLTTAGQETQDSLRIEIQSNNKLIATGFTSNGLFHFDLKDKLKPTDNIRVKVFAAKFDIGVRYQDRRYGNAETETQVGKAQNLVLNVPYSAPEQRPIKLGGVMIRDIEN